MAAASAFSSAVPFDILIAVLVLGASIGICCCRKQGCRRRRSVYDVDDDEDYDPVGRSAGSTHRYRFLEKQPHLVNVEAFRAYSGIKAQNEEWRVHHDLGVLSADTVTAEDLGTIWQSVWRPMVAVGIWSLLLSWFVRFAMDSQDANMAGALKSQNVIANFKAAAKLHEIVLVVVACVLAFRILWHISWLWSITQLVGNIRRPIENIAWLVGSSAPVEREDLQRVFWALHRYLNAVHVLIYCALPSDLAAVRDVELVEANLLMREEVETFRQSSARSLESVIMVWIFQILTQLIEVEVLDPGLERELLGAMTAICKSNSNLAHELERRVPPSFILLGAFAVNCLCILTPPAIMWTLLEDRRGERDGVVLMAARLWDSHAEPHELEGLQNSAMSVYMLPLLCTSVVTFIARALWAFGRVDDSPLKRKAKHIDLDDVLAETEEVTLGHLRQNPAALPQLAYFSHAYDVGVFTPQSFSGEPVSTSLLTTHFVNKAWRGHLRRAAQKHLRDEENLRLQAELDQKADSSEHDVDGQSSFAMGRDDETSVSGADMGHAGDVDVAEESHVQISFCDRTLRQLDLTLDQQVAGMRRAIAAAAAGSGTMQALSVDAKRLPPAGETVNLLKKLSEVVELNAASRTRLAEEVLRVRSEREKAAGEKPKFGPRPRSNSLDSQGVGAVLPYESRGDLKPTHAPRPRTKKAKAKAAPMERPPLRLVPGHHVEVFRSDGVWSHGKITRVMADGSVTVLITESRKLKTIPGQLVKRMVRSVEESGVTADDLAALRSRATSQRSSSEVSSGHTYS